MSVIHPVPAALAQAAAEYGGISASAVLATLRMALREAGQYASDHFVEVAVGAGILFIAWTFFFRSN
ncbi:hypothetical protein BH18GEM1_BH18GEM1_15080 [soil metagenome]